MHHRSLFLILAAVAAIAGTVVEAHHPFAATYAEDREVTITGEIVQVLIRDPHTFLQVRTTDGKTARQVWSVEWLGRTALFAQGVSIDSLRPGDVVVATGSPGRIGAAHRLRLKALARPKDHWQWQAPPPHVQVAKH